MKKPKLTTKLVYVTVAMAAAWLERNSCNRPMSMQHATDLAAAMTAGEWAVNGDTIRFDKHGVLIDGQHRLKAIIISGKSTYMVIAEGLEEDAFDTIDNGLKIRNNSDILARRGEKNYSQMSSCAARLWRLLSGAPGGSGRLRPPVMDKLLNEHPGLREAVRAAMVYITNRKDRSDKAVLPVSIVGPLYYMFGTVKPEKNKKFWDRVLDGVELDRDMPEYWLRRRLLANLTDVQKLPTLVTLALVIKAWNLSAANKPSKALKWISSQETFPLVNGYPYPE